MIRMLPLMQAVQHGCQAAPPPSLVSPCSRHLGRRGGELIRDKSSSASPSPPAQINEEYTNRPEGYLEGEETHLLIQTGINTQARPACAHVSSL
ncbi:hypothetical protein MHYP_G00224350 [Metynnis hypsauchen]